ncbi:hypothetical protein GYMLUDRAFT_61965 [Collybiopsis luxurians FD-317 M1]|uniref:Unplaced genomic scaffold GYMLUscaffold_49, whole genome shotgun sequence n=1 Tax=Collybiopsis luxurians FD-317 M1 TaxID=944289 RepID=A0A0D0B0H7_9AGAR|nr:hypothetical protein GYMLUDRAFT_61965 [Collybiopsis luxurians FD-317 M1]
MYIFLILILVHLILTHLVSNLSSPMNLGQNHPLQAINPLLLTPLLMCNLLILTYKLLTALVLLPHDWDKLITHLVDVQAPFPGLLFTGPKGVELEVDIEQKMFGLFSMKSMAYGTANFVSENCIILLQLFVLTQHSKDKAEGKRTPFNEYASTTGTDNLWDHLIKYHLKSWIEACVAQSISLKSAKAQTALNDYKAKYVNNGTSPANTGSLPDGNPFHFSCETMIDAIMEHIIADDEVRQIPLNNFGILVTS